MTIQQMNEIILNEQLDLYSKFYANTIFHGEDCLSYKKTENGKFEVLAMGERGKIAFHYKELDENFACNIILEYLRDSKFLIEKCNERKKKQI